MTLTEEIRPGRVHRAQAVLGSFYLKGTRVEWGSAPRGTGIRWLRKAARTVQVPLQEDDKVV